MESWLLRGLHAKLAVDDGWMVGWMINGWRFNYWVLIILSPFCWKHFCFLTSVGFKCFHWEYIYLLPLSKVILGNEQKHSAANKQHNFEKITLPQIPQQSFMTKQTQVWPSHVVWYSFCFRTFYGSSVSSSFKSSAHLQVKSLWERSRPAAQPLKTPSSLTSHILIHIK